MIVCFFVGLIDMTVTRYCKYWQPIKVFLDNKEIEEKLLYFLASPPRKQQEWKLRNYLGLLKLCTMTSIWVCHHLLEDTKARVLITSKKEFGGNYRVGKRSCCHKLEEKS